MRYLDRLHPFLFACFVPLALFARNSNEVGLDQLATPIGLIATATLSVITTLWLLGRDLPRFRILVSMGWLAFFLYVPLHEFGIPHKYLLVTVVIGWGILIAGVWRLSNQGVHVITRALVMMSLLLTANPLRVFLTTVVKDLSADYTTFSDVVSVSSSNRVLPDIYYFILDGYAGQKTLLDVFEFDNHQFISELQARGFYVAVNSHSNYASTLFSVPSTLNMDYLESMEAVHGTRFEARELKELAMNGPVVSALKGAGYRMVYIDTSTHLRPASTESVDEYREYSHVSQFAAALYALTPFRYLPLRYVPLGNRLIPPTDIDGKPWLPDSIAWAFNEVRHASRRAGPKFVFVHVLSPHSPYYHNAACNVVPSYRQQSWNNFNGEFALYRAGYVGQLECLNSQMVSLLDELLADSHQPPIIVVQADHGPPEIFDGSLLRHRPNMDLDAFRFGILNALLLPEDIRRQLHPSISPVNTFRLILNHALGRNYELLPDRMVRRRP